MLRYLVRPIILVSITLLIIVFCLVINFKDNTVLPEQPKRFKEHQIQEMKLFNKTFYLVVMKDTVSGAEFLMVYGRDHTLTSITPLKLSANNE